MSKKTKKSLSAVVSIVLILAFVGVLAWGIVNYDKVKDGLSDSNLYTKADIDASYEDGYKTALVDKESLLTTINTLRATISANEDTILLREAENNDLRSQISNLQNESSLKDETIAEKEAIIAVNNETIKELRAQIGKLESSIEEYKALVDNLKASYEVTATFIFDGQVHKVAVVKRGECVGAVENPTSSSSAEFTGWQVDGVTVDPTTFVLQNDTIFLAATNQRFRVDYFANGEIFTTQYVTNNAASTIVDSPTLFGHTFKGWSLDGVNVIETNTYPITTNTVFYAVFEEVKCTITFMVDDTAYNTQTIIYGSGITIPTNPTKTNYTFKGWSLDGTTVATISPAYVEDTTYIAVFEKATIRLNQTSNTSFDCAPFSITWQENNPSKYSRFVAVFDDVYFTGIVSDGRVVLSGADNLSTKQCYSTISEINLSHTSYEFTDKNGYKVRASYKTSFTDVLKALVLEDYNENNCQYIAGADGIVAWSYYLEGLLIDIKIEIDGEYQAWPNTIQINFDCVGYAKTSKSALVVFESVYGYTPRFGYGSSNNLSGDTTL